MHVAGMHTFKVEVCMHAGNCSRNKHFKPCTWNQVQSKEVSRLVQHAGSIKLHLPFVGDITLYRVLIDSRKPR